MATPTVYVLCDANCRWEGMTREQILTAIMQAVNEGTISNIDAGFVQTIKTINGHALKFFVGEQYEYDALTEADKEDLFALITNDTTKEGLLNAISNLQSGITDLETKLANGSIVVSKQNAAKKLTSSGLYAIRFKGDLYWHCAFVYWLNGATSVQTVYHKEGLYTIEVEVSTGGNIFARCHYSNGNYENFDTEIYTAKIGE